MMLGDLDLIGGCREQRPLVKLSGDRSLHIGPASIDMHLGGSFLLPVRKIGGIRLGEKAEYKRVALKPGETFDLRPGQFVLGTTMEYIDLSERRIAAFVQGRSSIGRIGLTVQNAGFVDPGFYGQITLELKNDSPSVIHLAPGYRVAQLVFMETYPIYQFYNGKYNGQLGATESLMQKDVIE